MRVFRLLFCVAILASQGAVAQETDAVSGASPYTDNKPTAAEVHERVMQRLTEELGLSIEQQAVLADIVRDYGPRIATIMRNGVEIGWSIMDVAPKNPQYTVDTEAAAQAAATAAADWVRTVTEMRNAVYSILTQEQIGLVATTSGKTGFPGLRQSVDRLSDSIPRILGIWALFTRRARSR